MPLHEKAMENKALVAGIAVSILFALVLAAVSIGVI